MRCVCGSVADGSQQLPRCHGAQTKHLFNPPPQSLPRRALCLSRPPAGRFSQAAAFEMPVSGDQRQAWLLQNRRAAGMPSLISTPAAWRGSRRRASKGPAQGCLGVHVYMLDLPGRDGQVPVAACCVPAGTWHEPPGSLPSGQASVPLCQQVGCAAESLPETKTWLCSAPLFTQPGRPPHASVLLIPSRSSASGTAPRGRAGGY